MFMAWVGSLLALLLAYFYIRDWLRSKWCKPHDVFGRCRRCEQETAARSKAKVQAEAEAKAESERHWLDIQETYKNMDETLRNELTALVLERAEREHLLVRSGTSLEAAVVWIYRRRRSSPHPET